MTASDGRASSASVVETVFLSRELLLEDTALRVADPDLRSLADVDTPDDLAAASE